MRLVEAVVGAAMVLVLLAHPDAEADTLLDVVPGRTVTTGTGLLSDPSSFHGLSVGLTAVLGTSGDGSTFGYDSVAASMRWIPGTNALGRRISILIGAANWRTPALSAVYPSRVLTMEEANAGSSVVNAAVAGVSVRVFGDRTPGPGKRFDKYKPTLDACYANAYSIDVAEQTRRAAAIAACAKDLWTNVTRYTVREPSLVMGALARVGQLAAESEIHAFDLNATFAAGKPPLDVAASLHYLKDDGEDGVSKYAVSGSVGIFADLGDDPPPPVLGLIVGLGYYKYQKRVSPTDPAVSVFPDGKRLDVKVSISGAPSSTSGAAGIGVRYTYVWLSNTPNDKELLLELTSNFKLLN